MVLTFHFKDRFSLERGPYTAYILEITDKSFFIVRCRKWNDFYTQAFHHHQDKYWCHHVRNLQNASSKLKITNTALRRKKECKEPIKFMNCSSKVNNNSFWYLHVASSKLRKYILSTTHFRECKEQPIVKYINCSSKVNNNNICKS